MLIDNGGQFSIINSGWEDENTTLLESTKGYSFAALYGEKGHPFLLEHMDAYMPCLLGVIAHMLKVEYFSFQAARNVK